MISRQDGGDKVCYIQPSDMVTCHQTRTYNYFSGDPLEISMERGRPFKNLFNNRHILRWTFSGQSQQDISWNIPEERRFFIDSKCWGYSGMLYIRQDHLEFLKFLGALTLQSYRKNWHSTWSINHCQAPCHCNQRQKSTIEPEYWWVWQCDATPSADPGI